MFTFCFRMYHLLSFSISVKNNLRLVLHSTVLIHFPQFGFYPAPISSWSSCIISDVTFFSDLIKFPFILVIYLIPSFLFFFSILSDFIFFIFFFFICSEFCHTLEWNSHGFSCKQPRCPSADEWIRKLWYIYTMEYYTAINSFFSCSTVVSFLSFLFHTAHFTLSWKYKLSVILLWRYVLILLCTC